MVYANRAPSTAPRDARGGPGEVNTTYTTQLATAVKQ